MSRVFVSESTNADIYVFSHDHCPPHIHARHRGEGWIARVRFSFLDGEVTLMSIAPSQNIPLTRTVNRLLADIGRNVAACRRAWWADRQDACLINQWAVVGSSGGIGIAPASSFRARQVASAVYDAEQDLTRVSFYDGTVLTGSTRNDGRSND